MIDKVFVAGATQASDLKQLFKVMALNDKNPFGDIIKPGNTVLIKPNLVRDYTKYGDFSALVTNGELINEVVKYVKIALKGRGKIIFGDSPVQDSNFQKTIDKLNLNNTNNNTPEAINAIDFRKEYVTVGNLGIKERIALKRDLTDYIVVNLGKDSELMDIISYYQKFRVTQYNSEEMRQHHNPNVNEYLIPKCVLEADVIINLPKLKTHKKSGFTCALKNLVGLNGAKAWLPHYRIGSIEEGGDEYLNKSIRKSWVSSLIEKRNLTKIYVYKLWLYGLEKMIRLTTKIIPFKDSYSEGSWSGNQTLPRMVADLNKIIFYADKRGVMQNEKQRKMFIIVDAMISGEGDGPMNPRPVDTNMLIGGENPVSVDHYCCGLIGLDPYKIPVLNCVKSIMKYPLVENPLLIRNPLILTASDYDINFNFRVPKGWEDCK